MGASNVARVYQLYGRLDDRPLRVLAYMALIARDGDTQPWFGQGHEAIAEHALAMDVPDRHTDPKGYKAVMRKVRYAVTPLFAAGAITTTSRPTNLGGKAVYRLWLTHPSQVTESPTTVDKPPPNPVDNLPSQVTESPTTPPRRRSLNGSSQVKTSSVVGHSVTYPIERNQRGTNKERKTLNGDAVTARCGKHARGPPQSLPATR